MKRTDHDSSAAANQPIQQVMARRLRHEIGDFLQKTYATVAILQSRLAKEATLEQDLLASLRKRADNVRDLVDGIQDVLCPLTLANEPVELRALSEELVERWKGKHSDIRWQTPEEAASVVGDAKWLRAIGDSLIANAIEAGAGTVKLAISRENEIVWSVIDDGSGVPEETLGLLLRPFFTTKAGHGGLGLALAHKVMHQLGGAISADNVAPHGMKVALSFPAPGAARE